MSAKLKPNKHGTSRFMLRSNSVKRLLTPKRHQITDELGLCGRVIKVPGTRPEFKPEGEKLVKSAEYMERARRHRAAKAGIVYEGS